MSSSLVVIILKLLKVSSFILHYVLPLGINLYVEAVADINEEGRERGCRLINVMIWCKESFQGEV